MSDNLISRKALISELIENYKQHMTLGNLVGYIRAQPVAYDTDKVIEQIGKKMFCAELHDNGWNGQTINGLLCMGDVYEIVKAGGVDE